MAVDLIKRRLSGAWTTAWQRITLNNASVSDSAIIGTAVAGYRLNTSGIAEKLVRITYTTLETWLAFGSASNYECRATLDSGALTSGTTGSWLALSSSREWKVERGAAGNSSATITVEIRNASTLVVIDSATITLEAERL